MKLYFKPGACSLASHIILREVGATFDLDRVDTKEQTTKSGENYREVNPKGYVPALRLDDDQVLTEGPAILQYIADQHPEKNLAGAPGSIERARINENLNFIGSELHKAFSPLFSGKEFSEDERGEIVNKIASRFDILDQTIAKNGPLLTGDQFTIADAYLFVVANWTQPTGIELDRWPHVAALVKKVAARTTVQAALKAEGLAA